MWAIACLYYVMGEVLIITLGGTGLLYWTSTLLRSALIWAFGAFSFRLDMLEQSLFQLILCSSLLYSLRKSQKGSPWMRRTVSSLYLQDSYESEDSIV